MMWLFFSILFMAFFATSGCCKKVCWFPFRITNSLFSLASSKTRKDGQPWVSTLLMCAKSVLQTKGVTSLMIFGHPCSCQRIPLSRTRSSFPGGGRSGLGMLLLAQLYLGRCTLVLNNQVSVEKLRCCKHLVSKIMDEYEALTCLRLSRLLLER